VDRFARTKLDGLAADPDLLPLDAGEVHLDARTLAIEERVVLETFEIEVAAELAIDARQNVEIELRRDAGGVVIGGIEDGAVLRQVDAHDEDRSRAEGAAGIAQERARLVRLEIADGRAREEAGARQRRDLRRNVEGLAEIRVDRQHRQLGKLAPQRRRFLLQHFRRDIDRQVGRHMGRGTEHDRSLGLRPAAELDERAAVGQERRNVGRVLLENAELGPRRIVFRKLRDAVEQARAGLIVEILRGQGFLLGCETGDYVGGKRLLGRMRVGKPSCECNHGGAYAS
jgi:hypothetical protein